MSRGMWRREVVDWPSYRRPITGQLYSEPCRCPHCEARRDMSKALTEHTDKTIMDRENSGEGRREG